MTATIGIDCDETYCGNRYVSRKTLNFPEMREAARVAGWTYEASPHIHEPSRDYCPRHKKEATR